MSYVSYKKDNDGVVTVVFDDPGAKVNVMNSGFINGLNEAVGRLEAERETVTGVIIASGKDTFFAGGDLNELIAVDSTNVGAFFDRVMRIKSLFRRMEKLGRPVVAAINGAALGGGFEICLACHGRIALNDKRVVVGLPEVTLGLLPGGGGVVRLTRLLGLKKALPLLLEGTSVPAARALDLGLIDGLATDRDDLVQKAKAWISSHPNPVQPWDDRAFQFPGGGLESPAMRTYVTFAAADVQAKTQGLFPAPRAILCAAVEGMQVDIDTADRIEARYLAHVATSQVAKNMISYFFQMNRLRSGESRPTGFEKSSVSRLGILGAGMMGSGIAFMAAQAGIDVFLKDLDIATAEKGKSYSDVVASKLVASGKMSEAQKVALLSRIQATGQASDLAGCDLVIEAVFEDRALKRKVTEEIDAVLADDAIFASNTSTLPITGLAQAFSRPTDFIGLHFFSPVDRMKLVEIICGKQTSDATLARAYDFVRQLGMVPIVVNDSRDFYTSRVFESGCDEGAWLLSDGVEPARIENLARAAGMPVGPLASIDAVSEQLVYLVKTQARKDFEHEGRAFPAADEPPFQWIVRMVEEFDRRGKAYGAGFYDYLKDADGRRYKVLWPGLLDAQPAPTRQVSDQDVRDRILYRQSIEAVRCLEEGVLRSVVDCNIGSILGIGFPKYTGGQLQYINACGVAAFATRAQELADSYGERFTPPRLLLDKAAAGSVFE